MAMIKDKSILLKIKYESSDRFLLNRSIKGFRPSRICCPICGAVGGHRKIRSYTRMMITVVDGERYEEGVLIPVWQCSSCGHAHAILPDVLIPFRSYTLRFILTVLKAYLERSGNVRDLCGHWQISTSTLYDWIHLFAGQFSAWRGILYKAACSAFRRRPLSLSRPALPATDPAGMIPELTAPYVRFILFPTANQTRRNTHVKEKNCQSA